MNSQAYPKLELSLQWASPEHRALVPRHKVAQAIQHALRCGLHNGHSVQAAQITVRIVGDLEARQLNQQFRSKDYATNVLTFEYVLEPEVCADLVLCASVLEEEAHVQHKDLQAHYVHMLVHGTLHAMGYDHERSGAEALRMESLEIQVLQGLGHPDPYQA